MSKKKKFHEYDDYDYEDDEWEYRHESKLKNRRYQRKLKDAWKNKAFDKDSN